MQEAKHTPGPWELQNHHTYATVSRKGLTISKTKKLQHCWDEQLANARLIAAAPELLEAAKEARQALWDYTDEDAAWATEAMRLLTAAIAKATSGEAA